MGTDTSSSANGKRIAKNTALLYVRMFLTMAITFYTSRVVLLQLGVNNYGIYSVVGGIVAMFAILSASLTSAISRFLTFELGKGGGPRLRLVFSTSVWIQMLLAMAIVLLVETGGIWFLNNKMVIAPERLSAAHWVLQCSLATFVINMLSVPYNAAIIAHERMQAFAYVSLLEVTLKLGVALMLYYPPFDSLVFYAVMLLVAAAAIRLTYGIYCKRHFTECHMEARFEKGLMKEMLKFSGWNFIGSASGVLRDQGVNIVINMFCGTALNAARAIAMQVYQAIGGFSQNFMLAVNPQIIKSYAAGDKDYTLRLAFQSAKLSYFLLLCLSLPLLMEMPFVLKLWLSDVPDYADSFASLMLLFGLSESLSIPLQFVNQATGRIKVYQLIVGGMQMLNFPLAYLLLRFGASPDSVFVLVIVISQCCLGARLLILRRSVGLDILKFLKRVYAPAIGVTILGAMLPFILSRCIICDNWGKLIGNCALQFALTVATIYLVGCNRAERDFVREKALALWSKICRRGA